MSFTVPASQIDKIPWYMLPFTRVRRYHSISSPVGIFILVIILIMFFTIIFISIKNPESTKINEKNK